jgi:hypothetical protein
VQASINMAYTIDCESIKLVGNFMLDSIPNPDSQWIEVKITNIDPEAIGLTWQLQTDKQNGLWFHGEGTITATEQDVILYADSYNGTDGKPLTMKDGGTYKFTITGNNFKNDGTRQNTCTDVVVIVGYKKKTFLLLGNVAYYNFWKPTTDYHYSAWSYIQSSINYALDGKAIFPVDGFNKVVNSTSAYADATSLAQVNANPDIIFVAYPFYWSSSSDFGKAMVEYVNKGGVVIWTSIEYATNTNKETQTLTDGLVNVSDASNHAPYQIPSASSASAELANDPIYTGKIPGVKNPVSLGGKYLANDNITDRYFVIDSKSTDQFVIYAGTTAEPRMIRYKRKNVVLIGDGAFAYSDTRTGQDRFFGIISEENPRPAHATWGSMPSDNSFIFENIMHWAIYQAEFHGINSGGLNPFE